MFQSRSGFSVFCDDARGNPRRNPSRVSIPFWVFCVLRRWFRVHKGPRREVSIPFWVFCVLRRFFGECTRGFDCGFQSRSGFSVFCDNIPVNLEREAEIVSIPFWVFCVLRQRFGIVAPVLDCFNPVLGFLCSATEVAKAVQLIE